MCDVCQLAALTRRQINQLKEAEKLARLDQLNVQRATMIAEDDPTPWTNRGRNCHQCGHQLKTHEWPHCGNCRHV